MRKHIDMLDFLTEIKIIGSKYGYDLEFKVFNRLIVSNSLMIAEECLCELLFAHSCSVHLSVPCFYSKLAYYFMMFNF